MQSTLLFAVLVAASLTCSLSAAADSFENEIGFNYSRSNGIGFTSQLFGLFATHHLNSVNTDSGPLGEAVFLSRVSSLGLLVIQRLRDFDDSSSNSSHSQSSFETSFAAMQQPVTASMGISRWNSKFSSASAAEPGSNASSTSKTNASIFHGGIGSYLGGSSHIGIDYSRYVPDSSADVPAHAWRFNGKHLATISETQFLSISADAWRTDSDGIRRSNNETLTAASEYYFTRATSVGVRISRTTLSSNTYRSTYIERSIRVTTFVTNTYRAGVLLQDVDSGTARRIGFDVSVRF